MYKHLSEHTHPDLSKRITACTTNRIWSLSTGVINWRIILLYNFRTTKTQSNPSLAF